MEWKKESKCVVQSVWRYVMVQSDEMKRRKREKMERQIDEWIYRWMDKWKKNIVLISSVHE